MGIVTNTYGSLKCPPVEAEVPPIEFCHKPSVHKTEISTLELPGEISLRNLSQQNTQVKQELTPQMFVHVACICHSVMMLQTIQAIFRPH
jgi:hypothetical protein